MSALHAAYLDPYAAGFTQERTDQGVDFSAKPGTPIRAIGKAKILGIEPNWYQGQPFVYYELLEGEDKGKVSYVAEQITPTVKPGQIVPEGGVIGLYAPTGTGIEAGWATPSGQTLAQATTGYTEGAETPAAKSFAGFLGAVPHAGVGSSSSSLLGSIGGALEAPGNLANNLIGKGAGAVGGLLGEGASAVGKPVAEGLIGLVKPIATKLALYFVLILGGVAMIVFGISELLRPVGGPKLSTIAARGVKLGEDAPEAAVAA